MRSYTVPLAAAADLLCVMSFVAVGRIDHGEGLALAATARTAGPFLASLAAAWLITRAWRGPARIWPTGVEVWALTVTLTMVLRLLLGEGAAPVFMMVTGAYLAAAMLGWRGVVLAVERGRARRALRG